MYPDTWRTVSLGEIANVTSGGTPSRTILEYWDGSIPWVTTTSINFNLICKGNEYITEKGLAESSARLFPAGTLLMAMYGQGVTRGRVAILGIQAATNQACAAILPNQQVIDTKFLFYYLSNKYIQIREMGHGGNQKNLNGELIKQIAILLPTLPEQRKIAEILSTWDEAIDLTAQLMAAKQRRKQALMQRLLTGQVRFPGFEGEWEKTTLGGICNKFVNGGTPSTSNESFWGGDIPWITGADIVNQKVSSVRNYISPEGVQNSATNVIDKSNLLVVTRTGVGKLAIAPFDLAISQDLTGVYVNPEKVSPVFLFYYLDFRVPLLTRLNQGTSINGITRQTLVTIEVSVPQLKEQEKIISVFEACDNEIDLLQQKLTALRRQKQGLMQQLLTGKVRVQV